MIVREVLVEEKAQFNSLVSHPLQSWEWGEFRQKTGVEVVRLGIYQEDKLSAGYQVTIHSLPKIPYTIIYFPRGPLPDKLMLVTLKKLARLRRTIFVKLEPNVHLPAKKTEELLLSFGCRVGRPYFTPWSFQLNLNRSEEEILARMKPKTRYNLRLSQKHQVKIIRDKSAKAFTTFLKLMWETCQRQGFYAHSLEYHQTLWETLAPTDIYHLFLAEYQGQILAAYVFFVFNKVLYYPYGGSTRIHKEVMPTYSLFWEAIKFGKEKGCQTFDMWGSPGPNPSPKDPWYGFHHFKQGFGADLVQFMGTYDLITEARIYPFFNLVNDLRWKALRIKSFFS